LHAWWHGGGVAVFPNQHAEDVADLRRRKAISKNLKLGMPERF